MCTLGRERGASRSFLASILVFGSALAARPASAITVPQVDVFGEGDFENWQGAATATVADAGPNGAGDVALRLETTGFPAGLGSRLVAFNADFRGP